MLWSAWTDDERDDFVAEHRTTVLSDAYDHVLEGPAAVNEILWQHFDEDRWTAQFDLATRVELFVEVFAPPSIAGAYDAVLTRPVSVAARRRPAARASATVNPDETEPAPHQAAERRGEQA